MRGISYRDAGVDIDAGDELVERIKPLAARTRIPEVVADVGGFAGLCRLPTGLRDPLLVSGTDGVGTKLKIAFATGIHDTVGIDAVAMCVNDIVTAGARPLFFLDYFATGTLDVCVAEKVIAGVAEGCVQAECALLGGETAELPGFYPEGEYELVGFAVGAVDRSALLDGKAVKNGDVLVAVASSGLHSNGYSLARKVLLEHASLKLDAHIGELNETLGASLIRPTRIYARAVRMALESGGIHALTHITGGGLPGNVPRVLPDGLGAFLDTRSWAVPPIFDLIAKHGRVTTAEMRRTFNLGIGLVAAIEPSRAEAVLAAFGRAGERAWIAGHIEPSSTSDFEARVRFG